MPPPRWRADWVFSSCAARGDVRQGVAAGRRLLPARRKACALRSPALRGGAGAKDQPIKTIAHDGTVTFYAYTAKGQEAERATFAASYASSSTRPALSLAASVISSRYHVTFNLLTKRAEPGKFTVYTYDNTTGNLTAQSEMQTTDATGAAQFSPTQKPNTPIKATGWSYNGNSLPVTIVERETAFGATAAVELGRTVNTYSSSTEQLTSSTSYGTKYEFSNYSAAGVPQTLKSATTDLSSLFLAWSPSSGSSTSTNLLSKSQADQTSSSSRPSTRPDGNPWGWGCGTAANDHRVPDGWGNANWTPACRTLELDLPRFHGQFRGS
jgi:hypothetical protein